MQDYEQISVIYESPSTRVLKVRRRSDNKTLVSKQLFYGGMPEKSKHRLVSEVNILRELKHPNVVRYHEYLIDKPLQTINIIMEFCENGDLRSRIQSLRKSSHFCSEEFLWRVFSQLSLALHEIHRRKNAPQILHRNLRPENVFLDQNDNVKLGDFGLSKVLNAENEEFMKSKAEEIDYLAPEVLNEERYNEKAEIWSLGCLLHELCALNKPFEATNEMALALKIREGKVAPLNSRYSLELRRVISWTMSFSPKARPSVEDLLNIPEVSKRLREKRLKESRAFLRKKTEELGLKEQELRAWEEKLRRREDELREDEEREKTGKGLAKRGTARFEEAKNNNENVNLMNNPNSLIEKRLKLALRSMKLTEEDCGPAFGLIRHSSNKKSLDNN